MKTELKKLGKEGLRSGRGAEERVLAEGLKGEAAEELGNAISVVIVGAIVDEHDDQEHGDVGEDDHRDQPGSPVGVVVIIIIVVALVPVLPGRSPLRISISNHDLLFPQLVDLL